MTPYAGAWDHASHPKPIKAQRPCCEACGRPFPKAKPIAGPIDTADMTDAQLYAHYKRTAIAEDLKFFLRLTLSPELRTRAESLTNPSKKDLAILHGAWRSERQTYEQQQGIPAVHSPRQWEYYRILNDAPLDLPLNDAELDALSHTA